MDTDADKARRATLAWQYRLLPLMIRMLAGLTIFFFVASFGQLFYLHTRIENAPTLSATDVIGRMANDSQSSAGPLDTHRLRVRALLEANVIARRYHQANVLLMSRVWTNYLGFVTGMILALVGAAFILGQLQTATSELEGKSGPTEVTLRTTSPGLALCVLGVALMMTTIIVHHDIETKDAGVYVGREGVGTDSRPALDSVVVP